MTKEKFTRVPYGSTVHGQEEIDAVISVLKESTQMGAKVTSFENKIAQLFEKEYGLMTNSGSSALYLAIESLDLDDGAEVITPALTFATTVACLVKNNLIPSFVDVKEDTYCIDEMKIEKSITKKTRAILAPDLLGNICRWDLIKSIADKHNLLVLHDSADTLGATYKGKSPGVFTDLSITSFYGSHIINGAGNGGMLCSSDDSVIKKAKLLRSWGRSSSLFADSESIENRFQVYLDEIRYDAKFVFEEIGYQLEPSEISAAFGLIQLEKLAKNFPQQIVGVKDSSYNLYEVLKIPNFLIFPGSELKLLKGLELGNSGIISAVCNVTAPLARKVYDDFNNKKTQTFNKKLCEVRKIFDNYNLISGLHSFMSVENEKYQRILPPLSLLSETQQKEMMSKLKGLDFFPEKNIAA